MKAAEILRHLTVSDPDGRMPEYADLRGALALMGPALEAAFEDDLSEARARMVEIERSRGALRQLATRIASAVDQTR